MTIDYQEYILPKDKQMLERMKSMKGFSTLTKKFFEVGYEQYMHQLDLASKIRLSETQLPEIYNLLPPICEKLGVTEIPDLYLETNGEPNAYTYGDKKTAITITTGLIDLLNEEEIVAVLAHECGHIACHHVLYHTIGMFLFSVSDALLGFLATPIKSIMFRWMRESELSCDRAASIVTSPQTVKNMMAHLAGASSKVYHKINMEEWAKQGEEYKKVANQDTWNQLLKMFSLSGVDHPFFAVRVNEILKWENCEKYNHIQERIKAEAEGREIPEPWHIKFSSVTVDVTVNSESATTTTEYDAYVGDVEVEKNPLIEKGTDTAKEVGSSIGSFFKKAATNVSETVDNIEDTVHNMDIPGTSDKPASQPTLTPPPLPVTKTIEEHQTDTEAETETEVEAEVEVEVEQPNPEPVTEQQEEQRLVPPPLPENC